ncbi:MAG: class I SAM-dependent methyltransferase [Candidatus Dormibacteria bacterium]
MNTSHLRLCSSRRWAEGLQSEVLEPLAARVPLGDEMLELGPGPGAATAWLCRRVRSLTAVEIDGAAAERLAAEYSGTNVRVVVGDCSKTGLPRSSFDSVGAFTMLHHLPTTARQLATLKEAYRVLRPGGALLGCDSLASAGLHQFHSGDTYNPVDPARLLVMLQSLGFTQIMLLVDPDLVFSARKPGRASRPASAALATTDQDRVDEPAG